MDLHTKKNLLIIQNDIQNCNELHSLLEGDFNITETDTIDKARHYIEAREITFCTVLIDVEILKADDGEFLNFMKDITEFSLIPILLLINSNSPVGDFTQFGSSVVDCIQKPYNTSIIKNRIMNAILLKDSISLYGIEKMLKELPSNIYLKDREGRYIFATHYWHHLDHGNDPNWNIRGKTDVDIRKDKENALAAMQKDLEIIESGKGVSYTIEINEDGIQEFFNIIKEPLFDEEGKVSGIIGLINNVTEHELLKKELETRSRTDALTGLYNRTYFYDYLDILQMKDLYPISIISADCDGLKKINDTYGHLAGDEYIRMSVELFKMVLPENDVLFRIGGDEFLMILPNTSTEAAAELVKQMKDKEKLFQIKEHTLSISFGIACLNSREDSFEDCLAESDKNMYNEKKKTYAKNNSTPRSS